MTEILRCPLLPDVEPRIPGEHHLKWVTAGPKNPGGSAIVSGPFANSPEEAIALWNAWMQPLHDMQAERDQFDRIAMDAVAMNVRQASRLAALEAENERLRSLLADWQDFAEDVGCADPAGKDWLYVLKGLTRAALEQKPC